MMVLPLSNLIVTHRAGSRIPSTARPAARLRRATTANPRAADGSHHGPVRMILDFYSERTVSDSRRCVSIRVWGQVVVVLAESPSHIGRVPRRITSPARYLHVPHPPCLHPYRRKYPRDRQ